MKKVLFFILAFASVNTFHANAQQGKTVNMEVDPNNVSIYYYSSNNDWDITLKDGDGNKIELDYISNTFDGTFTISNCYADYTRFADASFNYDYFTTLNLTVTGESDKNYEITGTAVGESGTTYTFHVKKDYIDPKRKVAVKATVTNAVINEKGYTTYQLKSDTENGVTYQICMEGVKNRKNNKDKIIVKDKTFRKDKNGKTLQFINGTISVGISKDYTLSDTACLVMSDSVEYDLTFTYNIPVKATKDVTITNCKLDDSYLDSFGLFWFYGSNNDYLDVLASCNPSSYTITEQDYTDKDIYFTLTDNDSTEITFLYLNSCHQTVDPETGKPVITATFLGDDCVKYNLSMSYKIPEKIGDRSFTFKDLPFNNLLSYSKYQIMGYDEDKTHFTSIVVNNNMVAGEYTFLDGSLPEDYNFFAYIDNATKDTTYVYFVNGTARVKMDRSGKINLSAVLRGEDGYDYHITITSQYEIVPLELDSEDTDLDVSFSFSDDATIEKSEDETGVSVILQNEARNDVFYLYMYLDKFDSDITIPEGTYTVDNTYEAPSVAPGDYNANYEYIYPTYYGTYDEDDYVSTPLWYLESGTVTVTKTTDKKLAFEVNGKNSYGRSMHVTYGLESAGIKSTDTGNSSVSIRKIAHGNQVVIQKGDRNFTLSGQKIK